MDAETVAKRLTEAQKLAVLGAEPDGHLGRHFIRWWDASSRMQKSLRFRGLGTTVWSGLMLTPLGEAVRAILKGE